MINRLTTIVVDNKSEKENLLSEHGLSFWIEADEHRILFDTGQSNILAEKSGARRDKRHPEHQFLVLY
jgi:metal-dependent hydrolase (beta-lactamase superfamily II)